MVILLLLLLLLIHGLVGNGGELVSMVVCGGVQQKLKKITQVGKKSVQATEN